MSLSECYERVMMISMNRMNGLLDVSHMDGAELLMPEEKELCSVSSLIEVVRSSVYIWFLVIIFLLRVLLFRNVASTSLRKVSFIGMV